ncbi:SAM-dependent methyltransferase [Pseudoalteromonas rhizosphaerae]|uniref:Phytanoyl-CoA dioxygenase n=1 Tax=Pseudoalteromonas rhizosphaerae TaxID=2518973 RepID=A0ABW8KV13_9GAMM
MEAHSSQSIASLEYADPQVDELLKHSIRTQLESLLKAKLTTGQRQLLLQKSFVDAMTLVLSNTQVEHLQLVKAFEAMYDQAVLSMSLAQLSQEQLTRQYVSASGLIMSPYNCKHTIKDAYRIQGYARGIDQAIQSKLKHSSSITILYPACGPFAPLLLPLLSYYKNSKLFTPQQINVILVDVHPGAILSLQQLVKDLQLDDFILRIETADATEYEPVESIDLLVLEAMQHGFTKEGQLSIAKHLVQFLTIDGWMIPQNVSVRGMMVIGESEFNQQWNKVKYSHSLNMDVSAQQDRVELGEILRINKSTLLNMQELELQDGVKVIPARQIKLPTGVKDMGKRILAIYAHIDTFAEEGVGQYDSGITHPRPDMTFYIDSTPRDVEHAHFVANSGDTVQFYYQLSGFPGFVPVKM